MNEELTNLSIVRKSPDQVSCDMGGESVMLHIKSGMYYGTDETGALIWNLLDEPRAVGDIRDAIAEEFDVGKEQCERDLIAFLAEMRAADLIEIQNGIETETGG